MPGVVREGDVNSAGGKALKGDKTLIIDGRPTVVIGTAVSRHAPCRRGNKHCNAKTTRGSKFFILNGKPVNVIGDPDSCGHPRKTGSSTFIVGE